MVDFPKRMWRDMDVKLVTIPGYASNSVFIFLLARSLVPGCLLRTSKVPEKSRNNT